MALEFVKLNLLGFAEGQGQLLTTAWLCFMLKYGCQAPIAANAHVKCCASFFDYLAYRLLLAFL